MSARGLSTLLVAAVLTSCGDGNYAETIADRAFAHGEGQATASEIFGEVARTCIGVGDREEAFAGLDPVARRALSLRDRDQYSVVVAQFDETGNVILRRRFHLRNAFAFIDIDEPRFSGSGARCLDPTSTIGVVLNQRQHFAAIHIP